MNNFTLQYKTTFTGEISINASSYEEAVKKLKEMELNSIVPELNNCDEWDLEVK